MMNEEIYKAQIRATLVKYLLGFVTVVVLLVGGVLFIGAAKTEIKSTVISAENGRVLWEMTTSFCQSNPMNIQTSSATSSPRQILITCGQ